MRNQIIDILENNLHAGDTPVSGISEAADEIVQFFGGDAGMQEHQKWQKMTDGLPEDGQKIFIWGPYYVDPEKRIWQANWNKCDLAGYYWMKYVDPPKI